MKAGLLTVMLLLKMIGYVFAEEQPLAGDWIAIFGNSQLTEEQSKAQVEKIKAVYHFEEDGTLAIDGIMFYRGSIAPPKAVQGFRGHWKLEPGDKARSQGFDGAVLLTFDALPSWKVSRCSFKLTATTLKFAFCSLRDIQFTRGN
ncbi:hypothetical protein [Rhizobium sp. RCC_161_2]|uniref:hypothetical protein n=1 Tax=Rhizobium sp. RCC_161_2 TaxID=3239219 RepID=UPI00352680AB